MKKVLRDDLILYTVETYPFRCKDTSSFKNEVTIGIGGNVGNTIRIFQKLFLAFQKDSRFKILKTAPILQNPPFGYLKQNDFLNSIIVLKTNLSAKQALKEFQRYENRFKRKRSFKDAPRTLDIDIIFFKKANRPVFMRSEILNIPHVGWKDRESVTIPLQFI
jgi:2-amino-4-hydroxy-6-hydroxymethyldihydropteridine diphosphokinase